MFKLFPKSIKSQNSAFVFYTMLVLVGLIKYNENSAPVVSIRLASCPCCGPASLWNPSKLISEVIPLGELAPLPSMGLGAFPVLLQLRHSEAEDIFVENRNHSYLFPFVCSLSHSINMYCASCVLLKALGILGE